MLGQTLHKGFRRARMALGCSAALAASGCETPTLNLEPGKATGPTVIEVEDHVTCLLATALDKHLRSGVSPDSDDYKLWRHLVDDNFLDTVNLTLFVTKSEGLNPSLNFIEPMTSLGGPIVKTVGSSNGLSSPTNVTANTYNLTLAVGVQLTGLQDRNFVQTYIVDLHRMFNDLDNVRDDKGKITHYGALDTCQRKHTGPSGGVPYSMKGDLALEETLKTGLEGLKAMPYAPVTAGSASASKSGQQATTASVSQSAGASSFSSKVDFSLTWAVNGGPSWTLLRFKGPGGGGTGASGQLLNYSRQKQDTLISTFSATCKSDELLNLLGGDYFTPEFQPQPQPFPNGSSAYTSVQFEVYVRKPGATPDTHTPAELDAMSNDDRFQHTAEKLTFTLAIPADKTGLPRIYSSAGTGFLTVETNDSVKNAIITWTTISATKGERYTLRGALTDSQSGTALGYIYASLGVSPTLGFTQLTLSKNALAVKRRAKGTPYGRRKGTPFSRSSSGEARSPQLAQRVAAG